MVLQSRYVNIFSWAMGMSRRHHGLIWIFELRPRVLLTSDVGMVNPGIN